MPFMDKCTLQSFDKYVASSNDTIKRMFKSNAEEAFGISLNNLPPHQRIREMIHQMTRNYSGCGTMEIQRYCALRFGPQRMLEFDMFRGLPMTLNEDPVYRGDATFVRAPFYGNRAGIATMTDFVIEQGTKSHIFFEFANAGLANQKLYYEIGAIRPLSPQQWGDIVNENRPDSFNIRQRTIIDQLNTMRNERWMGDVDCCFYNPRGRIPGRSDFKPHVIQISWDQEDENETMRTTHEFEHPMISVGEDGIEKCGLELDLTEDDGVLTYFTEGMPRHSINGLRGDYTWFVAVHGKTSSVAKFICRAKTYS